jgi:hypothetical protein
VHPQPPVPIRPGTQVDVATIVLIISLAALYLLPVLVATARGSSAVRQVVRLDLRLGWTGIGWIAALVIACASPTRRRARG